MRFVSVLLCVLFFSTHLARGEDLKPGDTGYKHLQYHKSYQGLFDSKRCRCQKGECRATVFRPSQSESGYDVLMDGQWLGVPSKAIISNDQVPLTLRTEPAHACGYPETNEKGYPTGRIVVDCAVINGTS